MQRVVAKLFLISPKLGVLLLALSVVCPVLVRAQIGQPAPAASTSSPASPPTDPLELGRETPRGTVIGFIRATQSENYDIAVQYFEPRHRAGLEPEQELAQQLLAILNAKFVGSLDSIPNDPTGRQDGGPPREQVIVSGTRGLSESFPLDLVHAEVAHGVKVWLISRQTLDQVPEVYDSLRFPQLEKRLPKFLVKTRFLGMPLWQWMAIVLFAPVALLIGWLAAFVLRFPARRIRSALGLAALPEEPTRRFGPTAVLAAVKFQSRTFLKTSNAIRKKMATSRTRRDSETSDRSAYIPRLVSWFHMRKESQ